jgi:peptide deformylase
LRAAVPRHERVRLTGVGADGSVIDQEISGFHARVVQHEADHLDGVMYPMRLRDFRYFGFNEELQKFHFPLPDEEDQNNER